MRVPWDLLSCVTWGRESNRQFQVYLDLNNRRPTWGANLIHIKYVMQYKSRSRADSLTASFGTISAVQLRRKKLMTHVTWNAVCINISNMDDDDDDNFSAIEPSFLELNWNQFEIVKTEKLWMCCCIGCGCQCLLKEKVGEKVCEVCSHAWIFLVAFFRIRTQLNKTNNCFTKPTMEKYTRT